MSVPVCPSCDQPLTFDGEGVEVYECHSCQMTWPESYFYEFNGRECGYYARYYRLPGFDPTAICGFCCVDEPSCITDEPTEGWPPLEGVHG